MKLPMQHVDIPTMRRGVGVGAIKKKQNEAKAFAAVGKAMEDKHITHVSEMIESFKTALLEFASKHKDRINADPEFRQQFHMMCSSIGVDPLASNKGFWSDLLGVGDFYSELGVQIIQIGVQTRSTNGGIMSMKELHERLRNVPGRRTQSISVDDIRRSIEKISVLGNGLKIIQVSGLQMVVSIPLELTTGHHEILSIASESEGYVSERKVCEQRGWARERFYSVINLMVQEGLAWVDRPPNTLPIDERYYFLTIWRESVEQED